MGVTIPTAFVVALTVALALTPVVRWLAGRVGAVDAVGVSARKVHLRTTPRLGGLAIAAAFYAPLVALLLVDSGVGHSFTASAGKALGLLLGGLPIIALGVYDDIHGANAKQKFLVQFAVAGALYALGFRINAISIPLGGVVDLGLLGLPLTLLWIVGLINAFNLIDGLDGLAAGVAFFGALTTLVVAVVNVNVLMALFMAALSGALLGFLFFNFNPASIFMGDTGSMFVGYVIAATSIQTSTKGAATVALLTPVLALGLPIMDTLLAMSRRILRGQSPFHADREHIHHRLLSLGFTHRRAVLVLYGASLIFGTGALLVSFSHGPLVAMVLAGMGLLTVVLIRALGFLRLGSWKDLPSIRELNLRLRQAGQKGRACLRRAASTDEVLSCALAYGAAVGSHEVRVRDPDGHVILEDHVEPRLSGKAELDLGYALGQGYRLDLVWLDGRSSLPSESVLAIEDFVADVETALARVSGPPHLSVVPH